MNSASSSLDGAVFPMSATLSSTGAPLGFALTDTSLYVSREDPPRVGCRRPTTSATVRLVTAVNDSTPTT
jgi:hypothetical protein